MNRHLSRSLWASLVLTAGPLGTLFADGGASGWTERVSFAADGSEIPEDARFPAVSDDGRFVAYATDSALLPADTNGERDVYVYDRETDTLVCASTNHWGDYGNGPSSYPSLSADGRWVAFQTEADNLEGIDDNDRIDVYVRDLELWTIHLVSRPTGTVHSGNGHSLYPSISDSGRWIAFESLSDDFGPLDTNGTWDVYVHDQLANTQSRAGIGFIGDEPNGASRGPSISADGQRVAYASAATNLTPLDNNNERDVFVHDFDLGATHLVSASQVGLFPANGDSHGASISADGMQVAFISAATDLDPRDLDPLNDVYHADMAVGEIEIVSLSYTGAPASMGAGGAEMARGGGHVTFTTESPMLPDFTGHREAYLRDLDADKTWLVSRPSGASALSNGPTLEAVPTADGCQVFFGSLATFEPRDTNGVRDVYVRTMIPDPFSYCEAETTSEGCLPSASPQGIPSAAQDFGFALVVSHVPLKRAGALFYGLDGAADIPFKGGRLCVAPPLRRGVVVYSGNFGIGMCGGRFVVDMNAFAAGALGGNPSPLLSEPGQQVNAQFWGRDSVKAEGAFMTDAIQYVVGP